VLAKRDDRLLALRIRDTERFVTHGLTLEEARVPG
jgi:hypothetical protein